MNMEQQYKANKEIFENFAANPQKFLTQLGQKQSKIMEQLQQQFVAMPQKIIDESKKQQENFAKLNQKTQSLLKNQPIDYTEIQKEIYNFNTNYLISNAIFLQQELSKTQEIISA